MDRDMGTDMDMGPTLNLENTEPGGWSAGSTKNSAPRSSSTASPQTRIFPQRCFPKPGWLLKELGFSCHNGDTYVCIDYLYTYTK